jgi:endonuclease/exonuclease/phosphatase family metal-dependent hydrolase
MTIKLLQLNINADNYWDKLVTFLTSHDFDILQLQEITGKDTRAGNINSQRDVFSQLQKILEKNYEGELTITQRYTSSPFAYLGNGTFYKKTFSLIEKKEIVLSTYGGPFPSELKTYERVGRKALHLNLEIEGKHISFLNTHFAWAKTSKEEPHQTKQGEILVEYLQKVTHPFVLSGDFNLDPQQPTIHKINHLARNLTEENHVSNTLNPQNHRARELFPPGVAVDYIFVSRDLKPKNFSVIEDDLSDHLGLTAEIEI